MLQRYVGVLLEKTFQVSTKHQICLQETVRRFTGLRVCVCVEHCPSSICGTLQKTGVIKFPTLRGSNNANVGNSEGFPEYILALFGLVI